PSAVSHSEGVRRHQLRMLRVAKRKADGGMGCAPAQLWWSVRLGCRHYRPLHFLVERMRRFTSETGTPQVRAMVAVFRPALKDARMRFAYLPGFGHPGWLQQATKLVGMRSAQTPRRFRPPNRPVSVLRSPSLPPPADVAVPSLPHAGAMPR